MNNRILFFHYYFLTCVVNIKLSSQIYYMFSSRSQRQITDDLSLFPIKPAKYHNISCFSCFLCLSPEVQTVNKRYFVKERMSENLVETYSLLRVIHQHGTDKVEQLLMLFRVRLLVLLQHFAVLPHVLAGWALLVPDQLARGEVLRLGTSSQWWRKGA